MGIIPLLRLDGFWKFSGVFLREKVRVTKEMS